MNEIRKIALFTSGGDAPGMNAAIRAIVRTAIYNKLDVSGILRGYEGMINGSFIRMDSRSVSNIIQHGGTILKTARSKDFLTEIGMKKAADHIAKNNIDAVVAIGGDGTFKGAEEFKNYSEIPFIGIPATIDNDLSGTDFTIGYDTAINTVVQAVDKIRDTADSHDRLFFVEVMGRDAGQIAIYSGIASGAESILIPETETLLEKLINTLESGWNRKKSSCIIIVAEGDETGGAFEIARKVKERFTQYEARVCILGHIQRGGSPTAMDRVRATRLGIAAVEAVLSGQKHQMLGIVNDKIVFTPFKNAVKQHLPVDAALIRIPDIVSV